MTASLLQPPPAPFPEEHVRTGRRVSRPAGGRPTTLAESLAGALRAAHAGEVAECPVCRAGMRLQGSAARCGGCGSTVW
jgi:hypothetical protein